MSTGTLPNDNACSRKRRDQNNSSAQPHWGSTSKPSEEARWMWLVLQSWCGGEPRNSLPAEAKGANRSRDVFELLLAAVLEWKLKPAGQVFVNAARDADSSRLAEGLKPRGHIDAITENVLLINDDVALVHAHPEL